MRLQEGSVDKINFLNSYQSFIFLLFFPIFLNKNALSNALLIEEMQPYSPNSLMSPRECQEITIKGWQDALPEQGARSQYHIYSFPKGDIKSYYQSRRKKPILFF